MSSGRFDLSGRTALVTGAARGLGRGIAIALAEAGADVALGLRDVSRDEGLAEEIRSLGRRALSLQMDVGRLDQVEAAVAATVEEFGGVDLLVNNAGGGEPDTPVEEVSLAAFQRTLDVNLRGTFFACQAAFPSMRERGFGRIVNVSSQAGEVALCPQMTGQVPILGDQFYDPPGPHNPLVEAQRPGPIGRRPGRAASPAPGSRRRPR